ncbi:hypothetical protein M1615_04145 [Patescibacteria group bacterium]|nr:hypothetical protein [Patescibacteria group bacterium]MCL5010584.1 hypothetical protein [Patescibacteria group bacterium]
MANIKEIIQRGVMAASIGIATTTTPLVAEQGVLVGSAHAEALRPSETVIYDPETTMALVPPPGGGVEIRGNMKQGDIRAWVGDGAEVGGIRVEPETNQGAVIVEIVAAQDVKDATLKTGKGTGLMVNARTTQKDFGGMLTDAVKTAEFQAQLTEGPGNCGLPNGCSDITVAVFDARINPNNPNQSVYDVVTEKVIKR